MLGDAIGAFLSALDRYTLADIALEPAAFAAFLPDAPPRPRRPYRRKAETVSAVGDTTPAAPKNLP